MPLKIQRDNLPAELEVRIRQRSRAEMPTAIFLMFWLVGWAIGEIFALHTLINDSAPLMIKAFLVIWLSGWTVGGVFAFMSLLKMLGGHEAITLGRGMLLISKSFVFFKHTKRYDTFRISDLHALNKNPKKFSIFNGGLIQFKYDNKEVRFGSGLSKEEKRQFFDALKNHRDLSERNFG